MQQAGVRPRENTPWRKGQCSTGIWSSGQALRLPSAETLEKRLAESSSSDRRGWGGHWAHLRHPSCSELHSCISARCSAGRRNTHTQEKHARVISAQQWKDECADFYEIFVVSPSLAWTLANFCLPELENVFFHWNFRLSEQFQLHYQWDQDKNGQDQCLYVAMHKLWDLGALPSSSVPFNVSFISWLNANQMANAVPHCLHVTVSMGKEYRCTNQGEICLPSLH